MRFLFMKVIGLFKKTKLDDIVAEFDGVLGRIEAHNTTKLSEAEEHRQEAAKHSDAASAASQEADRAMAIAANMRKLLAK